MNGKKIIATLIVLGMVLSTMVVLNKLNINLVKEAGAVTPGVNAWGNATTDLEYGVSYSAVRINTVRWNETGSLFLYYPTYKSGGIGGNANEFTWDGPYLVSGYGARITRIGGDTNLTIDTGGLPITFNRSGMWIFDNNANHRGDDNTTYAGYIWVNTSTKYSIESVPNFDFGASGSVTITVDTGNDTGCMIAIMGPDNNTIYHKWRATGVTEPIKIEAANFSKAGDYTVKAYRDLDAQNSTYYYPDENNRNFSMFYGSDYSGTFPSHPAATSEFYNYANMGPWDPPEKNATAITFTVNTGVPTITLTNTTIYWGFKTRIDINVTDPDGNGIDIPNARSVISLKKGATYYHGAYINNTQVTEGQQPGNYSIEIPRWLSGQAKGWTNLTDWVNSGHTIKNNNTNGTWRVVFGYDVPLADTTYEWNNSASFSVKSANPPVQIVIVNDGSGKATDNKINVPDYKPTTGYAQTVNISFDIFGKSISGDRAFYGDQAWEDWKNITVAGDILYPITETTLEYTGTEGNWVAHVTPTKPGGTITLTIDWPGDDNGTASQTIEIVNGTFVTSSVDSFTVGADYNLTVTITDMDGAPVKNAYVYLMWQDSGPFQGQFNSTTGTNKAGNGLNGEYTFWIPPHKKDATTPDNAPQNITVAAQWYGHFWGYTKVIMARDHIMQVNITPTTSYAGDATEYDIMVSLVGGGHPDKTSGGGLKVMIYNSTGDAVTNPDIVSGIWPITGSYDITNREIILSGGTYYLYAYNDTSDSRGNNATLIISNYIVTSSPSVLAWKIDTDVNMTFQLMPAGNGTLTLNNMSSLPNASFVDQSTQIAIENGVGTLDGVNATTLGNVTFDFTPDGGEDRSADGLLRVTTATATPSPATAYIGEPTTVTITVTHPSTGAPLDDVRVGLDHGMNLNESILAKFPTDQFTDTAGKVTFSITTEASGNITIFIENETDPDNPFVIMSAARQTMTITSDPSVNEGQTFTVQVKSGATVITGVTITFSFAGQTSTTTNGVATLTAPTVSTSLTYTITATADGYTSASTTIMVINVPKLVIIPPGTHPKGTQKFTITIANDEGAGVAGAAVAFNGNTYYSGANGITEITAPDVKTKTADFQISATFTGYTPATAVTITIDQTPGIPGFELLTLVAAIGVAFLLLRRRQK
jgi:hypothetical protein